MYAHLYTTYVQRPTLDILYITFLVYFRNLGVGTSFLALHFYIFSPIFMYTFCREVNWKISPKKGSRTANTNYRDNFEANKGPKIA